MVGLESISVGLPPVETVDIKEKTAQWLNRSTRSCNDDDEGSDGDEEGNDFGNFEQGFSENNKFMHRRFEQHLFINLEPPDATELSKARKQRKQEIRMSQIIKEIIAYVLFLLALFLVSFGQRDPQAYFIAKLIEDTYLEGVYTGQKLYQVRYVILINVDF